MNQFKIIKMQAQARFWHCLYAVRRDSSKPAHRQWQRECQENAAACYKRAREHMGIENEGILANVF